MDRMNSRQRDFDKKLSYLKKDIQIFVESRTEKTPINVKYLGKLFNCKLGLVDRALMEIIQDNKLEDYDVVESHGELFIKKV